MEFPSLFPLLFGMLIKKGSYAESQLDSEHIRENPFVSFPYGRL